MIIEDDDYTETDLKNVAEKLVELIDDTNDPIESTVEEFLNKYKDDLLKWKEELSQNI